MKMNLGALATLLVVFAAMISLPAVLLLLLVGYEIFLAPPVLTYDNIPFPVENQNLKPGDPVTIVIDRCANDPLAPDPLVYTFSQEVVAVINGSRTGVASGIADMRRGCEKGYRSIRNILPDSLQPGQYYLHGLASATGLFKVTTLQWTSQQFIVERSRKDAG